MPSKRSIILFFAIIAVVGWFESWLIGLYGLPLTHRESHADLIDAYVEALAAGQSHLGVSHGGEVSKFTTLDTSSYAGRYYVYYGIGPFALALAPWKLLTGTYLEAGIGIVAALVLGYAGYGWALLLAWQSGREQPRPSRGEATSLHWLVLPAGFLALIASNGTLSLLDTIAIHQLESSWAFASVGLSIGCLATAVTFNRYRTAFLTTAVFFAAFTMACRPNAFPMVAVLSLVALTVAAVADRGYVAAPLLAIGLCLAAWNFVRFDNPIQFGTRYGTGPAARPEIAVFSVGNVPYNLHRYLLGEARVGRYFPFIDGVKEGPIPLPTATHEAMDQVYGCFVLFPVLGSAALALWQRRRLAAPLLVGAAGNLLVLTGLGFGTYRYPVDFLGPLSFAAALGILSIATIPIRTLRFAAVIALLPLLAYSAAAAVCLAASVSRTHSLFDTARPADFAKLAAPFNRVAYRIESWRGRGPESIRLTIRLPGGISGKTEPLLVTGDPALQDFIYLYYTNPGQVQIGFSGRLMSAAQTVDYSKPHVVGIDLGTMLPPTDHPLLRSLPPESIAAQRRRVRVTIDGVEAINGSFDLHPIRSQILIGESPDDPAFGKAFSGTIERIERIPIRF